MQREHGESGEGQSWMWPPMRRPLRREREQGQGRKRRQEDKTRGRPPGEKWGGGCLRGAGGAEGRTSGDLHLSFWSVSGTSDGELVQDTDVSIHLVDDKHLQGEGHEDRCLAVTISPYTKAAGTEGRPVPRPSPSHPRRLGQPPCRPVAIIFHVCC